MPSRRAPWWSRSRCSPHALLPWLERFGATRVVLGGSIAGAFDVVAEVFRFPVSATADAERSALIGAALHYERSTGSGSEN